ncbi:MAG: glycerol kinase GlpK, partial [Chloroflexi bacterium]|nr:glycerol kinase GlpK [Chloroflexota bacterium]
MPEHILAIDQGTTSTRAIVFDSSATPVASARVELSQHFPQPGWVEHDPIEIAEGAVSVAKQAIGRARLAPGDIAAIGITNQRETTIVWERSTGRPVANAIVWQDRRTADYCDMLKLQGLESMITEKTGLLLDPYFSGTKVRWLLDNVEGAREQALSGELLFGTIDTFLLWRLTRGKSHKTDATNASRTLLFNIHDQVWDKEILQKLDIPECILPQVQDCSSDFGFTHESLFGAAIPITGIAGDQQAALVGQCCFTEGMIKSTYGTGCFLMMNTGATAVTSNHKLLTTVGYRIDGKVTFALEGSIFMAGAAVQWLRDGIKLISNAAETENIAAANPDAHGVYLVPAFTGLGAPYWDANARGAILGLTRNSGVEDIVTATLQSVCFQTRDLLVAMANDGIAPGLIRVDGGMVVNDWLMQCLSDISQMEVDRPQ